MKTQVTLWPQGFPLLLEKLPGNLLPSHVTNSAHLNPSQALPFYSVSISRKAKGNSPSLYSLICNPNPAKQPWSFLHQLVTVSPSSEIKGAQTHWAEEFPKMIKRKLVYDQQRRDPEMGVLCFSLCKESNLKTHKGNSDKEAVVGQSLGSPLFYSPPWGLSSQLALSWILSRALIREERERLYALDAWSCHRRKKAAVQMVRVMVTAQASRAVNLCMNVWAPHTCFLNMIIIKSKESSQEYESMAFGFMATGEIFKYFQ